jgi:DNA-binding MurR/RpiR family transcriptional regulator
MVSAHVATYESIGRTIVERFESLSPALQVVAECISQNPNDVAILNLSELSNRYKIPASNFVRFSKTLGFTGFADLQRIYRSRLVDIIPSFEDRLERFERELTRSVTPNSGITGLIREDYRLLSELDIPTIEATCLRMARVVKKSKRVFIISAARFFPVSFFLNYALVYFGINVTLLDNQGFMAREYAQTFDQDGALIVFSFNYYHRDVVSLTEIAAQKSMKILAVTDFEISPISKIADECIYLPGMGDNFRVSISPVFVLAQHLVNEIATVIGRSPPKYVADEPQELQDSVG